MVKILQRGMRRLTVWCRTASYLWRRIWVMCSMPDVDIGSGVRLARGVALQATDGGRIGLGRFCYVSKGATLVAKRGVLEVGNGTFIGPWSTLIAHGGIRIGSNCLIAERVSIRDQNHTIHGAPDVPIAQAGFEIAPITIGDGAWISAGAVLLKGIRIGCGAVVAANAVVVHDVADDEIVGGVPAVRIGMRATNER